MSDPSIRGGDVAKSATLEPVVAEVIASINRAQKLNNPAARQRRKQLIMTADGSRLVREFGLLLEHRLVQNKKSVSVELPVCSLKLYVASNLVADNLTRRTMAARSTNYHLTGPIKVTRYRQTVPRMTVSSQEVSLEFEYCRLEKGQPLAWRLRRSISGTAGAARIRTIARTNTGFVLR